MIERVAGIHRERHLLAFQAEPLSRWWVRRGAVRLEVETGDRLVLASAFRDDANKRIILVVINNRPEAVSVVTGTKGRIAFAGELKGEQSHSEGYWLPLGAATLDADGSIAATLAPLSVTTLSVGFR